MSLRRWVTKGRAAAPSPKRRFVYATGYLLMAVAGVFAGLWPSPAVSRATEASQFLITAWNVFLILGGVASAIGAVTERWIGEYTGLPLLASVFAVYGVSSIASGRQPAYAAGAAFVGIALLLLSRWLDVAAVRKLATAAGHLGQAESQAESADRGRHAAGGDG